MPEILRFSLSRHPPPKSHGAPKSPKKPGAWRWLSNRSGENLNIENWGLEDLSSNVQHDPKETKPTDSQLSPSINNTSQNDGELRSDNGKVGLLASEAHTKKRKQQKIITNNKSWFLFRKAHFAANSSHQLKELDCNLHPKAKLPMMRKPENPSATFWERSLEAKMAHKITCGILVFFLEIAESRCNQARRLFRGLRPHQTEIQIRS